MEKAPIYRLSRRKAPKTQQNCHYRHAIKTNRPFLSRGNGVEFISSNNFATLGSFAKASLPVETIIPKKASWSCGVIYSISSRQLTSFSSWVVLPSPADSVWITWARVCFLSLSSKSLTCCSSCNLFNFCLKNLSNELFTRISIAAEINAKL